MKLAIDVNTFVKFSQGDDIKADIKGGWCAGVTAMVSKVAGSYTAETGYGSAEEWLVKYAYPRAKEQLQKINSFHSTTQTLQIYLQRDKGKADICGSIHEPEFDGRACKVVMGLVDWWPLLSRGAQFAYYLASSSLWQANHVGLLIRGGSKLLLLDPNYGMALFNIQDNKALGLDELTGAIGLLAWRHSYAAYLGSYTAAIRVIDEDWAGIRSTVEEDRRLDSLLEFSRRFTKEIV